LIHQQKKHYLLEEIIAIDKTNQSHTALRNPPFSIL